MRIWAPIAAYSTVSFTVVEWEREPDAPLTVKVNDCGESDPPHPLNAAPSAATDMAITISL